MERIEMVMRVGMLVSDESDDVVIDGVKFEVVDANNEVIDIGDNEMLNNLANEILSSFNKEEA